MGGSTAHFALRGEERQRGRLAISVRGSPACSTTVFLSETRRENGRMALFARRRLHSVASRQTVFYGARPERQTDFVRADGGADHQGGAIDSVRDLPRADSAS